MTRATEHDNVVSLRPRTESASALRNEVELLSEEYDTQAGRLVGNFPQAFTHLALVNCALRLSDKGDNRESTG